MGYIKDFFNADRFQLVKENEKMRLSKKNIEKELKQQQDNIEELKDKYIKVLEEKCEGFDKYLYYQKLSEDYANEKRELKKELALIKEELKKGGKKDDI